MELQKTFNVKCDEKDIILAETNLAKLIKRCKNY